MIGIADQKLWNLGVGLWNGFFFLFIVNDSIITHSMLPAHQRIFFCFTPRNSSISSITNFLVVNMFARGNCELSGESMTASLMQC